jgi:hypothetical protein
MVTSFATSIVPGFWRRTACTSSTHAALLVTIAITTVCWLLTALRTRDGSSDAHRVLPESPAGGAAGAIRAAAGIAGSRDAATENIPLGLLGWVAGCTAVWSALFAVGNFLYGRTNYMLILTAIFIVSAGVLVLVVQRMWSNHARA